jgi:RNA-binding protein
MMNDAHRTPRAPRMHPCDPAMTAPVIDARRRKRLRGLAHGLDPMVHVGHEGVTDAVVRSLDEALAAHELIKVRLHQPADKRGAAQALADATGAVLCGLVGHTVILYRRHPERPRIVLD